MPVVSSQNDGAPIMYFQLSSTNTHPLFDLSGIIESFKTIQKNILIYLESDTFTFSQLKSNTAPEAKEISYEEKTENKILKEVSVLNMAKFKQAKKSKVLTPVNNLLRKVSEKCKLNFFTISQRFSNSQLNRLFPILNRFI